jgi:hypothetical protein
MCLKIKEKYHEYSDTNNIPYVVYDSERSIAASLIADVYLCRRLGLPNTQQIVLRVHSYSLHSFVDCRINWTSLEEATATSYTAG